MRAQEFIIETQVLDEIDMSPSSLKQLAAGTGAVAGMEFEMYVPDVQGGEDENVSPEPDYEEDQPARSIDQIHEFFEADGEWNSPYEVSRLKSKLQEEYLEWVSEKIQERWDNAPTDRVYQWAKENIDYDSREELDEIVDNAIEEGYGNDIYDQALDAFNEEMWAHYTDDDSNERRFLLDSGIRFMSDIESGYDITWPYWTYTDSKGERTIKQVALQFMTDLGLNTITISDRYHGEYYQWQGGDDWRPIGRSKPNDSYTIEPDGSLSSNKNASDSGLEFVSNALPLDDMINSLNDVVKWATTNGCYTNQSTGLHMNVSVPGCNRETLDYVKLALLLGDEYVLNQFGRGENTPAAHFTKSAMLNLKSRATYMQNEPELLAFFDEMRKGLSVEAAKLIHSGVTGKYVSINAKEGYIEFRSPGGDWLNEDLPKLENTLLRFVVALDAACDPQKYRREYLKKLEQLLTSGKSVQYYDPKDPENDKQPVKFSDQKKQGWVPVATSKGKPDMISYFAKYATGQLSKEELKNFFQRERGTEKPKPPIQAKVSAGPAEPAFGQPPSRNTEYQIYDSRTGEEYELFQAQSDEEALNRLDDYRRVARNSASSINPDRFVLRYNVN